MSGLADVLPTHRHELAAAALLALAFWATSSASLLWLIAGDAGAVVWPAAGVAVAALSTRGIQLWPGVMLGHLAATLTHDASPGLDDLLLAFGATLAVVAPVIALRRLRIDPSPATLHGILWLVVGAGASGATISTAAGMPAMMLQGVADTDLWRTGLAWWFGYLAGVIAVAPVLLSWRNGHGSDLTASQAALLAASVGTSTAAGYMIFLSPALQIQQGWFIFPALVWPALAHSSRGASLAMLIVAAEAAAADILDTGAFEGRSGPFMQTVLTQQFIAIAGTTVLIMAAVADERRGREQLRQSAERLREEREALEILNRTGAAIAAELDLDSAVRLVTDAGVSLSGARFGAFFYDVTDAAGEPHTVYAVSGASRATFARFGRLRSVGAFDPAFRGEAVVRVGDITADPRYEPSAQRGHPLVRSCLAVPVKSRSGEVQGGLFFGHPAADVFDERTERLIVGLAAQAAIAIDNGRLYQAAQREVAERRRAEEHQRLLMNELNHRVKNTLATVQSMGALTLRSDRSPSEAREAFVSRLMALSTAHNLLTAERWETAELEDVVRMAVAPFDEPPGVRFAVEGPPVRLRAQHALGLAMALHELGSNAAKYGALSVESGRVRVSWTDAPPGEVRFTWEEREGPTVQPPIRRGFGTRLIQEGPARELGGHVRIEHRPQGVRCEISFRHAAPAGAFGAADEA